MSNCPCGASVAYAECCEPVITGQRPARTAEELMRSRYSAFVKTQIDYLRTSLHPDHRENFDSKSTRAWAENSDWIRLEILDTQNGGPDDSEGTVEFKAHFYRSGNRRVHHERASFKKKADCWYYTEGQGVIPDTVVRETPKIGRNQPCPCGSGKKYKKCCGS